MEIRVELLRTKKNMSVGNQAGVKKRIKSHGAMRAKPIVHFTATANIDLPSAEYNAR